MHYLNYEEQRRHGTEEFPLEFYSVNEKHPRYQMPHHWHRENELIYVRQGKFCLSLNGVEHCVREGEFCYIPGGVVHGGEPFDCVYECIDFDVEPLMHQKSLVRSYLRKIESDHTSVNTVFTNEHPEMLKCLSRLFTAARIQKEAWEMLAFSGLFDFYGTVIQQGYYQKSLRTKSNQQKIQQIKKTIEFIELNYQHPITLEDLARAANLSPKYFCRYFRRITNHTPIDYLNYYRIEKACYLLEQGNQTVTEVALQCGFIDIGYFYRAFRKYKGTSPNKYLKEMQST